MHLDVCSPKLWSLCENNLIILLLLQLIQIVLPYSISVSLYSCLHSVEQSWGSQTIHHMTAYPVHRGEGWICCIATHRKIWYSITGITTKFCTWHDSYAVISCAKIGSDLITHNLITIKFFFSYVFWCMMAENVVGPICTNVCTGNCACIRGALFIKIFPSLYIVSSQCQEIIESNSRCKRLNMHIPFHNTVICITLQHKKAPEIEIWYTLDGSHPNSAQTKCIQKVASPPGNLSVWDQGIGPKFEHCLHTMQIL